MNKTLLIAATLAALLSGCGAATGPVDSHDDHGSQGGEHAEAEVEKGPNGGRLLRDGPVSLELAVYETGVPPEFRVWLRRDGQPVAPEAAELEVILTRLDGQIDRIAFQPAGDMLRGQQVVTEPHSFDVEVRLQLAEAEHRWAFESHEGRVSIAADVAEELGVVTAAAGPAEIIRTRALTGRVHADPARVARVRPRYAGLVQSVRVEPWALVQKGEVLATVQSNDSLQTVTLKAPIGGWVVTRNAQVGEVTGDEPMFVIVDLSQVWVEFDVFDHDLDDVAVGQPIAIRGLHGEVLATGAIDRLSPLAIHGAQSVRARVVVPNADGALRPGQYVHGDVEIARRQVPLAVERAALQTFRDFTVVFEQVGETYEVRMLELGEGDALRIEVLGGLKPGARYVVDNSYLIKADIDKSGASHDH